MILSELAKHLINLQFNLQLKSQLNLQINLQLKSQLNLQFKIQTHYWINPFPIAQLMLPGIKCF